MRQHRTFLTVMGILAALSASSFSTGCATSPTGRQQLRLVPEAEVDQLGGQAWQQTLQKYPVSQDAAATALVNGIARKIIATSPLANQAWDVKLFESKDINAFALPGGHIGVFTGLLPVAENAAGLATVLAHEVGHVVSKHGQERISDELLTQGALALAQGAFGVSRGVMAALGLGAQLGIILPYSRAQETEADHVGLMLMAQAGYDPGEALEFWNRMVAKAPGEPPAFLSDHPASRDRIAAIAQLLPAARERYARASPKLGKGARIPAQTR